MKTILLTFLLVFTWSAWAQENWIIESNFNVNDEIVSYKTNIKSIKVRLLKKGELKEPLGYLYSLKDHDSIQMYGSIKRLNQDFKTKVFSSISEVNQITFFVGEKMEDEGVLAHDFKIREWVFANENDAKNAYTFLLELQNPERPKDKVPVSSDWVKKDNFIYLLISLSCNRKSEIYQGILDVIKNTIHE